MKRKFILSIFATILTGSLVIIPAVVAYGQATKAGDPAPIKQAGDPAPTCTSTTTGCKTNPSSQAGGFNLNVKINNPLHVNSIQEAIKLFMNAIIKIAIPFIVVFFIWSGFNFIMAQGNPEKLKKAKMMFFNTVIGTLLILGAWAITNAIIGTVNSISS